MLVGKEGSAGADRFVKYGKETGAIIGRCMRYMMLPTPAARRGVKEPV